VDEDRSIDAKLVLFLTALRQDGNGVLRKPDIESLLIRQRKPAQR
jgi:hypothetical protein